MSLNVAELQGVSPEIAEKLRGAGLTDSDKLLDAVAEPDARKALAGQLESTSAPCWNWAIEPTWPVSRAWPRLFRPVGVRRRRYRGRARQRVPANLFAKIQAVAAEHSVIRLPRLADVESWVSQAKELGRKLNY